VLLAHDDPDHVRQLIHTLENQHVILHCDRKSAPTTLDAMISEAGDNVIVAPRRDTRLASWSLVAAELDCLRLALDRTESEHIIVISGADFPLVDPKTLGEILRPFAGRSWIWNRPLPFPPWNVPGFRDGGLWRMRFRFPTRNDQIRWIGSKPVFVPIRRALPADLCPRASMQWKVLSRGDASRLLEILSQRPDLIRFGRSTFTPEESFIASVLASPGLLGSEALAPCDFSPSLADWPRGQVVQHPGWFTEEDAGRIVDYLARCRVVSDDSLPNAGRPLFARKIGSRRSGGLPDLIRAQIW
jgi:hypothetical protein